MNDQNWTKFSGTRLAFCFIFNFKITLFYSLIRFDLFYHALSFAVSHCHFLLLVVIRCHSLFHSLSLVLIPFTIRCHLLSLVGQLVVTRCTTLLSFFIDLQWWKTTFTVFRETFLTLVCTKSRKSDHIDMKFYTRTN